MIGLAALAADRPQSPRSMTLLTKSFDYTMGTLQWVNTTAPQLGTLLEVMYAASKASEQVTAAALERSLGNLLIMTGSLALVIAIVLAKFSSPRYNRQAHHCVQPGLVNERCRRWPCRRPSRPPPDPTAVHIFFVRVGDYHICGTRRAGI